MQMFMENRVAEFVYYLRRHVGRGMVKVNLTQVGEGKFKVI